LAPGLTGAGVATVIIIGFVVQVESVTVTVTGLEVEAAKFDVPP